MKIRLAAILTMASASVSAQTLPTSYQTVCTTESDIGYSWRNGAYVVSRYTPSTYVIEVGDTERCKANPAKDLNVDKIRWRDVCAIITRVGETRRATLASHCRENYITDGAASSITLQCEQRIGENVWADPDGLFHVSQIHPDTAQRPNDGYKDSLSLGVGKCHRTE